MSLKRYGIIVVFLGWAFTAYSDAQKNVGRLFPVKQVVIWGYPLHSHTHSYIHNGFFRAFKHLGYKTLWLTDADDTRAIDFKDKFEVTVKTNKGIVRGSFHDRPTPRWDDSKT